MSKFNAGSYHVSLTCGQLFHVCKFTYKMKIPISHNLCKKAFKMIQKEGGQVWNWIQKIS